MLYMMHPALRKGPLLYKTPPIFYFFYKKTPPHFISCLRACSCFIATDLVKGWKAFKDKHFSWILATMTTGFISSIVFLYLTPV